jgi:putative ATP-dependent endonuclease of the OLD family
MGGRGVVIAYDEPDTHLDYRHQRDLVELIRAQASTPGVRIVVATHSLNLIDKVDIGDVVHLSGLPEVLSVTVGEPG